MVFEEDDGDEVDIVEADDEDVEEGINFIGIVEVVDVDLGEVICCAGVDLLFFFCFLFSTSVIIFCITEWS